MPPLPPGLPQELGPSYRDLAGEFVYTISLPVLLGLAFTVVAKRWLSGMGAADSWLVDVYYIASIAVPLIAIGALIYAKGQVESAREQAKISANASKAEVYRHLYQDVTSDRIRLGAHEAKRLYLRHQALIALGATSVSLGDYCAVEIAGMEFGDFKRFRVLTDLFEFLESLGLQARSGYLSRDILSHLLAGTLRDLALILTIYLTREEASREGLWTNANWLLRVIPNHQPQEPLPND